MAQAMMFEAVTGQASTPYSIKDSPWPVYDLFETKDGRKLFVSIVGEEHWIGFCKAFGRENWLSDPRLITSQRRVDHRSWIIPEIAGLLKQETLETLSATFEALALPFAPVNKPGDLFDDPHLNGSGGFLPLVTDAGLTTKTPALPFSLDGERLQKRRDPPRLGEHTDEVLRELGLY
jgi:crotonobetainyl-CoA:carnitine CoA-transferase CaiB-like acyl-CoA transferase